MPALRMQDRRSIVRLPCALAVSQPDGAAPLGHIIDMSREGLFIATTDPLMPGAVVPLVFCLGPRGPEIHPTAEVVRTTSHGMGLRLVAISEQEGQLLDHFIGVLAVGMGLQGQRACERPANGADAGVTTETLTLPGPVQNLLAQAVGQPDFTIIANANADKTRAGLVSMSPEALQMRLLEPCALRVGEPVFVLYTRHHLSYTFESQVIATAGETLTLGHPACISYSEKRLPPASDAPPPPVGVNFTDATGKAYEGLLHVACAPEGRKMMPAVVIAAGIGQSPTAMTALATTLIENFRHHQRNVAVLCYAPAAPDPSARARPVVMDAGVDALLGAMGWARKNDVFEAISIAVVSIGWASVAARCALTQPALGPGSGVASWVALTGVADAEQALTNMTGGIDICAMQRQGLPVGAQQVLGTRVDGGYLCADLQQRNASTQAQARGAMAQIQTDVLWLVGSHDAIVTPQSVQATMDVAAPGTRRMATVDTGHQPTAGDGAQAAYVVITRHLWNVFFRQDVDIRPPSEACLQAAQQAACNQAARSIKATEAAPVATEAWAFVPAYQGLLRELAGIIVSKGQDILVMGMGTEPLTDLLPGKNITHVRCDLTDCEAEGHALSSASFDAVLCCLLPGALPSIKAATRMAQRLLRPGGTFVACGLLPDADASPMLLEAIHTSEAETPQPGSRFLHDTLRPALQQEAQRRAQAAACAARPCSASDVAAQLRHSGFLDVALTLSLGTPPQAVIARGVQPGGTARH